MSKQEKSVLLLNGIFNFGSSLVANFVSVYLFIYTKSIPMMSLYIIVRIGFFPISFSIGNILSKKHSFTLTYTIGLTLITCGLLYALLATKLFLISSYFVLIAAGIIGCGEGFYYFSANTCNQIIPSKETRAAFFAYNGAITNFISIFSPMYASFLLSVNSSELTAYKFMLATIVSIFIVVIFIALSINKKTEDEGSKLADCFNLNDKYWLNHQKAVFAYGLRNALELNTMSLLVYQAAGSSGIYSKLQILFSILTVTSYFLSKRFLNSRYVNKLFTLGTIIKICATLVLIFCPNIYGAIIYGLLQAISSSTYDNSYNYLSANVIANYKKEMTARVVAREIILSLARCLAMVFILLCFKFLPSNIYLQVAVILLTLAPIFCYKIFTRSKYE